MVVSKLVHFFKRKIKRNRKSDHGNRNRDSDHGNSNSTHAKKNNVHGNRNRNNTHENKTPNHTNNNLTQIQSANTLLSQHKKLISDIYHHSHAPLKHFEALYLYPIKRLAVWVQSLPASQNHHHAHHGGFLLHTLEVVEIALKKRNTKMLPIGASVEKQNEKKDLYTFAVFVAALLHDVGKSVSDVDIMLYNDQQKELGRWSPWFGTMTDVKQARYYQYQYNSTRKYQQHSLLPLTFLRQFISPTAIDWMQQESDLFTLLLMTLQGRRTEGAIIADIVKYADSESSAQSLANVSAGSINAGSADNAGGVGNALQQQPQPKSLADKLLDTMRYLVLETDIKINVPGAPIFTTDDDIYFVSKTIMDKIRDSLNKDNQKGIPYNNSRMMDELLQFHIIVPNSEGKAIWNCELSGGGFKNPVNLTMLRVPLDKIYDQANGEKSCGVFAGDIVIKGEESTNNIGETSPNSSLSPNHDYSVAQDSQDKNKQHHVPNSKPKTKTAEPDLSLPMPPGFEITPNDNESANQSSKGSQKMPQARKEKISTSTPITPTTSATPQARKPKVSTPVITTTPTPRTSETPSKTPTTNASINHSNNNKQPQLETELGQDFFKWLLSAINNRKIQINTDQAKVHVVTYKDNKALFLVSPRIFKEYDSHQWARIQKQFGRLRLNLKTHTDENIWQVQTITYRLSKKPSRIQGYLIVNLERHGFGELPETNRYLDLVVD
jgi:integrating conjugative element relaxase (TIGR03760 family)